MLLDIEMNPLDNIYLHVVHSAYVVLNNKIKKICNNFIIIILNNTISGIIPLAEWKCH